MKPHTIKQCFDPEAMTRIQIKGFLLNLKATPNLDQKHNYKIVEKKYSQPLCFTIQIAFI